MARKKMDVSPAWLWTALLTFGVGFSVLIYLAFAVNRGAPPIPDRVLTENGEVLFTGDDVMRGQHVFQKFGLMQYGTIFGHGAYLGPDFTAEYLHAAAVTMLNLYSGGADPTPEVRARVRDELKANTYFPEAGTLVFTRGQQAAFEERVAHYQRLFANPAKNKGLRLPRIPNPEDVRKLTAFFAWAAWAASATRPGSAYSYTNNWPPEYLAGNELTASALMWSMFSLVALLGGIGAVFFVFGRYHLLGWHRASEEPSGTLRFKPPETVPLTPAQRATAWYFLVVAGLFLAQGLLGGANAHYHAQPEWVIAGIDVARYFPYNLTRTWHLQLAIFFVAASFLAMGIFITPLVAGREPRGQDKLAIGLFAAVVVVVVGSLIGELLSFRDLISLDGPWFWLGAQGWEYIDLGRVWQAALVVGMLLWVGIILRGLWPKLREEHPGNMPFLFLYSALSIPAFYAVGMVIGLDTNFTVMDFWRFWVVHLWVEDFLELFTTIMVAYVFVLLGLVRLTVATRVIYLDIILYSVGGVIGTMHHAYFSGGPVELMALGAFFSAMEVLPLVLLTYEAWRFMQLGSEKGDESAFHTRSEAFPHKWAVLFLIAVGFWNFLGAGVFGFLINLPVVSYWEIGTAFTANHGHGAMMGVYGMLAVGFFMFVARYFLPRDKRSETAMKVSFWSLNIGLAWMMFANLIPIGILQMYDAVEIGYWHAREARFFSNPTITALEWARLPGDLLFIIGGIVPLVYLAVRIFVARGKPRETPRGAAFTEG
ncbi:MAG: nitric-oxide reductase large subunit [Myxococcales bacterium]|jgi:nitric oxide reductase subunit B